MDLITKELLINVLFILLPMLLMHVAYFIKYIYNLEWLKESWIVICPLISIGMCMSFPFSLQEGLTWDLRRIPFLLGFLYGGYRHGLFLLAFVLLFRYIISGVGFYITVCTYAGMAILTSVLSPFFIKMSFKMKMLTSGLTVLISLLITYIASMIMTNNNLTDIMWIEYSLISIIVMLIATFICESINKSFTILEKVSKAEKLEVVSHLAASISHEVRNPLASCKGFIQLSYEKEEHLEIKEYLSFSIKELDKATEIINDYLIFARAAPEKTENLFIFEEVYQVIEIMTPLASRTNVQISFSKIEGDNLYVQGEKKKFQQAVLNIIKNAIEAMPAGGKVTVGMVEKLDFIHLTIIDQGKGMTKKQVNRLGEPYFTTKSKSNGTGLGLMVSFSILQKMGGEIVVKSQEGKGTQFLIKLPMKK
ncbi:HAMP domain-containing sensor histidine kinase [Domibacillus sp.]|uniref:HAMP domain-containing sensor histidine kinase n=1 Tax=Domibacillus sp. TaxID=1969783 RepID=UPI0028122C13|nr:HAMP domain-containing sensor histidine kinase [Domibacillus sp.]